VFENTMLWRPQQEQERSKEKKSAKKLRVKGKRSRVRWNFFPNLLTR